MLTLGSSEFGILTAVRSEEGGGGGGGVQLDILIGFWCMISNKKCYFEYRAVFFSTGIYYTVRYTGMVVRQIDHPVSWKHGSPAAKS